MMGKRVAVTAQTKQNIIDAFWQLYCQYPRAQITVTAVIQRAGYNRSTFYEYFRDVADVLDALEAMLIPTIDTLPPLYTDTLQVGMPMAQFLQWYKQHAQYYAVLLGERGDPAFAGKLKQQLKPLLRQLAPVTHHQDAVSREIVLEYVLSALLGVMGYWHQHAPDMPIESLLQLVHRLMTTGAMPVLATLHVRQ
ncbi:MAG: TetR/AcrR family transcriptional regulator [Roseiflexaceae bacterium]|jgi:AcrR family transcriptional regulator|nr:TetR/AcrR family transcriptional regulator [Chloroflexaceae bacterium]